MTEEEARIIWNKGWHSASSLAEEALQELLQSAVYRPETLSYSLNEEALYNLKNKMSEGLYKQIKIQNKAGLDYYFANTHPQTIQGGKPV